MRLLSNGGGCGLQAKQMRAHNWKLKSSAAKTCLISKAATSRPHLANDRLKHQRRLLKTMAALAEPSDGLSDDTFFFHQLDAYPWAEDEEFQGGLQAILGSSRIQQRWHT